MDDKLRDEVRTVHEAYQFLSRKYQLDKERLKEKEKEIQEFRDNGAENENLNTLIKVELDNDKKEPIGIGIAVSLKSAARTFKDNSNKPETQQLKEKLDSND